MTFQCPWDNVVVLITVIVSIIVLSVNAGLFITMYIWRKKSKLLFWGVGVVLNILLLITLFSPAFFMPINVSVDNESITIKRLYSNIVIPIKKIEKITTDVSEANNNIRTFGSGGFFGALGKFRSKQLGDFQMYVTKDSQMVLVKFDNKVLIFSCENHNELVNFVNLID